MRRLYRIRNYPVLVVEPKLRYRTDRHILATQVSVATQSIPAVSLDAAGFLFLECGLGAEGMLIEIVSRVSFLLLEHEVDKITALDVSMANFVCISVAVRIHPAARIDRTLSGSVTQGNTAEPSVGLENPFSTWVE